MEMLKSKVDFKDFFQFYIEDIKKIISSISMEEIEIAAEMIADCHRRDGFIYLFGNGGSGSTASHFVTDFNKVVSQNLKRRLKCICLNDNIPSLLAISNDISYEQVFKYQLENFLTANDLVIGISGSGNSANVVKAIEYANSIGADTLGVVGYNGGKLKHVSKHAIHIRSFNMQYVEDAHLIVNHLLGNYLNLSLPGRTA